MSDGPAKAAVIQSGAMMTRRTWLVYGVLLGAWVLIAAWQVTEHLRVRRSARAELVNHAKDISDTLGVVLRSQRHFGIIAKERLESALDSLLRPAELEAIAILNPAEKVVASAGAAIDFESRRLTPSSAYWTEKTVTLANLVDLGTNVTAEADQRQPAIILARGDRPPFGRPPPQIPPGDAATNRPAFQPFPPPGESTGSVVSAIDPSNRVDRPRRAPRRGDRRQPFDRPFWMDEAEYKSMIGKQGVHSMVIVLSTMSMRATCRQDLWVRSVIGVLSTLSVFGLGLAWRNLTKSAELELRLVRAAELNARLKEMNVAAAGLAHETRNPLNIIRGLAQMISKQTEASLEIHSKSREIIEETDRVTAQLNEFINYSRPREVRRATVSLDCVAAEVVRALGSDLEDKAVQLEVVPGMPAIEADEQLLRQALFNLLINAIQAVETGGRIWIAAEKTGAGEARLEVRDNGPGVAAEHRSEVFKPYFTTHAEGTGLGLAVVQQIVLAHGWEIECLPSNPKGAAFRISHMRLSAAA